MVKFYDDFWDDIFSSTDEHGSRCLLFFLSSEASLESLIAYECGKYGTILASTVVTTDVPSLPRIMMVRFRRSYDAEEVVKCLKEKTVFGLPHPLSMNLVFQPAFIEPPPDPQAEAEKAAAEASVPSASLYVRNFPPNHTDVALQDLLKKEFSTYGEVEGVAIRGFGENRYGECSSRPNPLHHAPPPDLSVFPFAKRLLISRWSMIPRPR